MIFTTAGWNVMEQRGGGGKSGGGGRRAATKVIVLNGLQLLLTKNLEKKCPALILKEFSLTTE